MTIRRLRNILFGLRKKLARKDSQAKDESQKSLTGAAKQDSPKESASTRFSEGSEPETEQTRLPARTRAATCVRLFRSEGRPVGSSKLLARRRVPEFRLRRPPPSIEGSPSDHLSDGSVGSQCDQLRTACIALYKLLRFLYGGIARGDQERRGDQRAAQV